MEKRDELEQLLGYSTDTVTGEVTLDRMPGLVFKIKPITGAVMDQIRERAQYSVKTKAGHETKTDPGKVSAGVILAGVTSPDLSDSRFAKKYGEIDPLRAIPKHFLFGEIDKLSTAILDLSGLGDDDDAPLEQAKN
jgi:hypothetical protein